MERLPVTLRQLIVALERIGFYVHHVRGSHQYVKHPADRDLRVAAYHSKALQAGGRSRAIPPPGNFTPE